MGENNHSDKKYSKPTNRSAGKQITRISIFYLSTTEKVLDENWSYNELLANEKNSIICLTLLEAVALIHLLK